MHNYLLASIAILFYIISEGKNDGNTCFTGDMTGDGIPDVMIYTNPGKLVNMADSTPKRDT